MAVKRPAVRWCLFLLLVLAVVLMHHVPGQHGQSASGRAAHAAATAPTLSAHEAMDCVCPSEEASWSALPGHGELGLNGLLHLCLAIAIAATVVLLRLALVTAGGPAPPGHRGFGGTVA